MNNISIVEDMHESFLRHNIDFDIAQSGDLCYE